MNGYYIRNGSVFTCGDTADDDILYLSNGGKLMDRNTRIYDGFEVPSKNSIKDVLEQVYMALEEKEYRAIDQMVGYMLSGDPTYITSNRNARNLIARIDRDDYLEELSRVICKNSTLNR